MATTPYNVTGYRLKFKTMLLRFIKIDFCLVFKNSFGIKDLWPKNHEIGRTIHNGGSSLYTIYHYKLLYTINKLKVLEFVRCLPDLIIGQLWKKQK